MAQTNVADLVGPIAQACRGCPLPTIIDAYVDAARLFCSRSYWLRDTVVGATVANTVAYALGGDANNEVIGIVGVSLARATGNIDPLTEKESSFWDPDDEPGVPEFYQYVPTGQIALHVTPDAVYPLTVSVVIQPILQSTSIDSRLVPTMRTVLEGWALAQILKIGGFPWSNPGKADQLERTFYAETVAASMQAQRGFNPAASMSDTPGQPSGMLRTAVLPI